MLLLKVFHPKIIFDQFAKFIKRWKFAPYFARSTFRGLQSFQLQGALPLTPNQGL